jgi:hypothetical protein
MPKKTKEQSQEAQSEIFKREAQKLINAGELNPTDADKAFEKLIPSTRILRDTVKKIGPKV